MTGKRNDRDERRTEPMNIHIRGNALFDRVVFAIGLDQAATRFMVADLLRTIGSSPQDMTPDELGALLPTLEHRVRLMVPGDPADNAVARLRQLLFKWDED